MNLEALIVLPQVTQAIRSRAVHVVRDRFAAPGFSQALRASARESEEVTEASTTYAVREGDFLTRIVRDHLRDQGHAVSNSAVLDGLKRVAEANGIEDANLIHPGQQIDLSVLNRATETTAGTPRGKGGRAASTLSRDETAEFLVPNRVRKTVARILDRDATLAASPVSGQPTQPWSAALGEAAELSSPYGYRRDPFTSTKRFHHGIDLAVPTGTTVHPLEAGEVVFSGWKAGYGRVVIVRHEDGVESVYGHASKTLVKAGEHVSTGDTIALSGSSGRSTGPHLHLEVRRNGRAFNPMTYLDKRPIRLARGH